MRARVHSRYCVGLARLRGRLIEANASSARRFFDISYAKFRRAAARATHKNCVSYKMCCERAPGIFSAFSRFRRSPGAMFMSCRGWVGGGGGGGGTLFNNS